MRYCREGERLSERKREGKGKENERITKCQLKESMGERQVENIQVGSRNIKEVEKLLLLLLCIGCKASMEGK